MADRYARNLRGLAGRVVRTRGWAGAALTGLALVNMVAQGATVALLVPLLRVAGVSTTAGSVGAIDRAVSSSFATVHLTPTLATVLAVFIGTAWIQALLGYAELVGTTRLEQDVVSDLREALYRQLLAARWPFFTARRATDLTHAVTIDTERAGAAVGFMLRGAAQATSVVIYAAFAIAISPPASAVALGGGLLLALLVRPTLRSAHSTGERMTEVSTDALALVTRHVDAMKLVKSYGAEARTLEAFRGTIHRSARSAIDATRAHARAHVATIAGSATLLGLALFASIRLLHLDAATILLLTFLFWRLVPRLMDVQQSVRMSLHELPGYEVVERLFDDAAAAREAPDDLTPAANTAQFRMGSGVEFEAVTFAYDAQPVLRGASCRMTAGRITAFAGPSGAGKTTIVDLLLGLLTPTAGTIRIDGRALDRSWLDEWRAAVAYVPQDPLLFHDTILANLRWANPTATVTEVWTALTAAAAAGFVRELPMGLDTVVGDWGVRLSGGERQRLALARALLRQPTLLVLDEVTSAVDAESEEHILQALVALRGSVTIALVSHRTAPLDRADAVYRLDDGVMRLQDSGAVYPYP